MLPRILPYSVYFKKDYRSNPSCLVNNPLSAPRHHGRQDPPTRKHEQPLSGFSGKLPNSRREEKKLVAYGQSGMAHHAGKHRDGKSLLCSDTRNPDWEPSGLFINQPQSPGSSTPSDTFLKGSKAQERISGPTSFRSAMDHRSAGSIGVVPSVQGNIGLSNAIRAAVNNKHIDDVLTVGLVGLPTDRLSEHKKTEIYGKLEGEFDALTVFVSDKDFEGHYTHYCKLILWPVFHYIVPDHPRSKAFLDHSWLFILQEGQPGPCGQGHQELQTW